MSEGAPGLGDASDSGHRSLQEPRVQALFGEPEVAEGVREASERIFGVDKDAERPLPEGTRLGPYRLDRLLGVGGQGFVYSARHTELGREVALKVPRRDIAESILREAQVAVSVSHEGVVRVEDVRTDGERPYLVMERMVGGSLAERRGPRPMAEVRAVGNAVLGALEFVHAQGVVHRDLKPANVLFDQDGRAKLSDLGIGVRPVAGLEGQLTEDTRSLTPMGTRLYAAPEQIDPARLRGAALDGRADLFSFGKLLFGMLTGEPPTTVRPPSRVRTGLDSGWDDFVFRLLEADREDRFPTAAATRKAFEELSISENDGGESISRPDSNSEGRSGSRRPGALGKGLFGLGVASLGLAAAGAIAAVFLDLGDPRPVIPLASIGAGALAVASMGSIRDRRQARRARRRKSKPEGS